MENIYWALYGPSSTHVLSSNPSFGYQITRVNYCSLFLFFFIFSIVHNGYGGFFSFSYPPPHFNPSPSTVSAEVRVFLPDNSFRTLRLRSPWSTTSRGLVRLIARKEGLFPEKTTKPTRISSREAWTNSLRLGQKMDVQTMIDIEVSFFFVFFFASNCVL